MSSHSITEPQKFATDILWVAISQILIILTQLVTLIALTKSYSPMTFGVWSQMAVTVGLLCPILTLQLQIALFRFMAAEDDAERRRRSFGTMLWPILVFDGLVFMISLMMRQNLSIFLFADPQYAFLVPLAILWAFMEALFSFSISYLVARRRIKKSSVIQLTFMLIKMILIVVLAAAGCDFGWIIICLIVGQAVLVAVVFGMIISEIGWPKPALNGLKSYLAFSLPLIPSGILIWTIDATNKYFITHFLNLTQTGIYSAGYTISCLISIFYLPLSFVLFPTVSRLWERKEIPRARRYLEYTTKLLLTFAVPGAGGLYILAQSLVGVFTTPEYMIEGGLILLLALGILLFGIYQIYVLTILLVRQTKWLPLLFAIAVLTAVGIDLISIPLIGITGAAISTFTCYFILAVIVLIWSKKLINSEIDFKFLAKVIAGTLFMTFCLSLIKINGVLGIMVIAFAGVAIFALWMWLVRAFDADDLKLIKEIILGIRSGALLIDADAKPGN